MVLKIDPANYQSLKIIISKGVTSNDVELVLDKSCKAERNVKTTNLPQLKLGEFLLFTENSICRYLFASSSKLQNADEVDKWLEWESLHLEPSLQSVINQVWGDVKSSNNEYISKQIQHLDTHLQKSHFLVDDKFSLADIAVAVSMFPLLAKSEIVDTYRKELPAILNWFERLKSTVPSFKEAILNCNIESVKDSFIAKRTIKQLPASDVSQSSGLGNELPTSTADIEQETALSAKEIQDACDAWQSGVDHCQLEKPSYPILPVDGKRNVLITSALPYVNNVPHLGNIIGCVLSADVFARFSRLRGYNTLYICGTDEYGTATETKALEEGVTPQQICDKYHKLHADIYRWFDISFDHFGRTTTEWQTKIAQDMFWHLHQNGYLLEDSVEQLLCTNCNRFLADRFVEGICPFCAYSDARGDQCDKCGKLINAVELKSPQCKICKATPIKKTSEHLFLDLPKLEPLLSTWIEKSINDGVWTTSAKVICRSWIRDGLKPRCITRDLKWGTPVPLDGYTDKVFYVWYDAPIGYLSITANYTDQWEKWWKNPSNVELFQFMAKDNVPFHGVIFPCTQLGTNDNYTKVNSLVATEYLNYEDTKFSKSREIGVFGNDASETGIPADIWRFYLLFIRPESQDSSFSWIDLMTKNNSELLNNLGNFVNRTTTFVCNNFNGVVPRMDLKDEDKTFIAEVNRELIGYLAAMEKARLRDGIRYILNISRRGNQYIQSNKPWVLLKGNPEEKACAGTLMGICLNAACLLSVMVQPYMPTISKHIQTQLNAPENCNVLHSNFKCYLPAGHKLGTPAILFHKIELADMEKFQKKFAGKQSERDDETKETAPAVVQDCNKVVGKPNNAVDVTVIENLKAAVTEQGDRVRALKAKKAEKSELDAELVKLFELKAKLASSLGEEIPVAISSSNKGKKKGKK